ncbi:MAG: FAD:protein FMN transferase [Verrucomicrobiae bacterium]|nr:FAD:protein FMN transferase [Verrucomicrobiae bacterium]
MVLETTTERAGRTELAVASGAGYFRLTFPAIGSDCLLIFQAPSWARAKAFRNQVVEWMDRFEKTFSRFLPDSLVSEINRNAGRQPVAIGPDAEELFALCDAFHFATYGIFDPTALPVIELWDYRRERSAVPTEEDVARARAKVGWPKVQRRRGEVFLPQAGMCLDLGGIGKEYAVDRVLQMALDDGLENVLVDFGHDVRVHGKDPRGGPWLIGLEKADDPGNCWGAAVVSDRAVATSGDYLRKFEVNGRIYGHIIDPRCGCPVDNGCRAVTVVARTCTEAGILSTAAFVLGQRDGMKLIESNYLVEGAITTRAGRSLSRGFDRYLASNGT